MCKAAKRLWFLKKLKQAGVAKEDLAYFFQTVVRPILEYACPAWHTSLMKEQSKSLENVQRRALQITVGNIPYEEACRLFDLSTLAERRSSLCSTLFRQITPTCSIICYPLNVTLSLYPGYDQRWNIQEFAHGQTDLRTLSYRIHFRTSSATCSLDCVNVLNL